MTDVEVRRVFGVFILGEWFENDSTRFAEYFKMHGITYWEDRDDLIMLGYKRHLEGKPFDFVQECRDIVAENAAIANERRLQYEKNIVADSIDGVFIPTDLNSCMQQLDKLLDEELKEEIRSKTSEEDLSEYHMGLGRWLRNNWNLWGGSRLGTYFIEKGVNHPDYMSGIILSAYHAYLTNGSVNGDEYINKAIEEQRKFEQMMNEQQSVAFEPAEPIDPEEYYTDEYKEFLKKGR